MKKEKATNQPSSDGFPRERRIDQPFDGWKASQSMTKGVLTSFSFGLSHDELIGSSR